MSTAQAAVASLLVAVLSAGCGMSAERLPVAQAQASAGSSSETSNPFSRMHAAIPASAVDEAYEYQ